MNLDNLIQNYINGNLSDAKKAAKRVNEAKLVSAFRQYGYSANVAIAIAAYLKGYGSFQAAADAEYNEKLARMNPTMHPTEPEKAQHTAEPWLVTDEGSQIVIQTFAEHPTGTIARVYRTDKRAHADAERLVECVNACASIPDPASAVPALVGALEKAENALARLAKEYITLTDGEFGTIEDFADVKEFRAAVKLAKGGKR